MRSFELSLGELTYLKKHGQLMLCRGWFREAEKLDTQDVRNYGNVDNGEEVRIKNTDLTCVVSDVRRNSDPSFHLMGKATVALTMTLTVEEEGASA